MKAKALAMLMLAAILLSGCASNKGGGDDDPGTGTGTSTKTGTGSGSGTRTSSGSSTGGPGGGSGTITVDFTRSTPDAGVPLSVNFTLNATFKGSDGKPATPASMSWSVVVTSAGNGTNATNSTTADGPTGTALPANFTLNFTAAGNHTVVATVSAPGFASNNASILVMASAGGATDAPLFFDGGEGDASQWTISETVYFVNNLGVGPANPQEAGTNHPDAAPWAQATDKKKTGEKSWHPGYTDFQRSRMVSVPIVVPASGGTLTYSITGGAEKAGGAVEGLFVLAGPKGGARTVLLHHEGNFADWTEFTVVVPGGEIQVELRFDTDGSCSTRSNPPANPVLSCGEGANGGGYWVDDIKVV